MRKNNVHIQVEDNGDLNVHTKFLFPSLGSVGNRRLEFVFYLSTTIESKKSSNYFINCQITGLAVLKKVS